MTLISAKMILIIGGIVLCAAGGALVFFLIQKTRDND